MKLRTTGEPTGEPVVLVLHGTTGSGASVLTPAFAGELFNPGQPLDAAKHFIILPDGIGHGKCARPSDGMRAQFPGYNCDNVVLAQYRLATAGAGGVRHLRLVIGNCMQWLTGSRGEHRGWRRASRIARPSSAGGRPCCAKASCPGCPRRPA